ncbi:MAG: hypothetical protein HOH70_09735, partial [Halieaceae bacterium]|nr:hypothetical protein [Halieaceae bacterium]
MNVDRNHAFRSTLLSMALWPCLVASISSFAAEQLQVTLNGLEDDILNNALASLEIARRSKDAELSSANIIRMHGKAEAEIRRALEPFGYYQPVITTDLQNSEESGNGWQATYNVDAGTPIPVDNIALSFIGPGADHEDVKMLAASLALLQGQRLDHRRYETGKRKLISDTRELGYLNAQFLEH